MENDDDIIGTILNRRDVLGLAARTGLCATLGGVMLKSAEAAYQAQAQKSVKLVASPAVTEGPFFVDEKLRRSDLLAGTKRSSVVDGVPLTLAITLYRLTDGLFAPLTGATVDLWHADAKGVYSDESAPMNHENTSGQKWLRGYQVSDANGVVRFQTIFPGWYRGRTTHLHFKVRQGAGSSTKEFTSQLFFDDALADKVFDEFPYSRRDAGQAFNSNDMVFNERQADGLQAGDHLLLDLKPAKKGSGYTATFAVALTDDNLRNGRSGRRFGRPSGRGPGQPDGPLPGGFGFPSDF